MKVTKFLLIVLLCLVLSPDAYGSNKAASLETMIGQMVMVGFRGTGEAPLSEDIRFLLDAVACGKVGGVILFEPDYITKSNRNIKNSQQLYDLLRMIQQKAAIPLFIGIDQEGGKVRRLQPAHGAPYTPSAKEMGKNGAQATYNQARELGQFLAKAGINLDFAPVVDVDVNAASPAIGKVERSFSANVDTVIKHARAFAKGLQSSAIIYCYKHFPGHGSASSDTHDGYTDITASWSEKELEPYRQLMYKNMPGMVMIGHMFNSTLDSSYPSSLSSATINGLLRGELGWQGVVITDDMQMGAIQKNYSNEDAIRHAINAGVDIILMGNNLQHDADIGNKTFNTILHLVKTGKISEERIEQSYIRILNLKRALAGAISESAFE